MGTDPAGLTPDEHRRLGVELFNQTWTLLDTPDRAPADVDAMIHAAHASRHHWSHAAGAGPENAARGEWQISRVYAVLGRGEPALWHARRCLDICREHRIGDWDLAFAYEALARASRVAGDQAAAERWLAEAHAAGEGITEDEERDLLFADLRTI